MANEKQPADSAEPTFKAAPRIAVKAGQFIQLHPNKVGRPSWFRCTNVNQTLNRDLSAIAVALGDFDYEVGVGAGNNQVQNFTLRQFYQDPNREQVNFRRIGQYFEDLAARGLKEKAALIRKPIMDAINEFQKQYAPLEAV